MSEDANTRLESLPIFEGLDDDELKKFFGRFERHEVGGGWVLFEAGSPAENLDLLLSGEVTFYDHGEPRLTLRAPAIIGELGVLTDLPRNTTARTTKPSTILRLAREELLAFLENEASLGVRLHQNLLNVVGDKVRRDVRRLEEMRSNIISTQKAMKGLRDYVLGQAETPISEHVHDTLEAHIARNRRVNYVIEPPRALPASVRLPDGNTAPVLAMSRNRLLLPGSAGGEDDAFKAVLVLPETEIPIDGEARETAGLLEIELGLLIDDYVQSLENYLTRAQILDMVV